MVARTLSSGFFVPADSDKYVTGTKATVGLGLGISLPSVLFTSISNHDVDDASICASTPERSSDSESASSPPLLPTRRSRPPPPTFSVESEYAPMITPSPSLRGGPFDAMFYTSARASPTSLDSPTTKPPPTNVGLGLALACLDAPELVTAVTKHDTKVGLGIDLPCLDSPDLVTIIRPTLANTGLDFSILDEKFEEIDITDALTEHSSCSSPSDDFVPWAEPTEGISDPTIQKPIRHSSPTLGLDSPFWKTYATVLLESHLMEEKAIYETS